MAQAKITPAFNSANSTLSFLYASATAVQKQIIDTWSDYQENYGIYGQLRLFNKSTYKINTFSVNGLMLKAESCAPALGSAIQRAERTITPCAVTLLEGMCDLTLLGDAINTAKDYVNGETIDTAAYSEVINEIAMNVMRSGVGSVMATLVAGGVYGANGTGDYNYASGATDAQKAAYVAQRAVCDGWLKKAMVVSNETITEADGGFVADNYTDGAYTGNVLTLFSKLKALAPKPLSNLLARGAFRTTDGQRRYPICIVDPNTFLAVVAAFDASNDDAAKNNGGRIKQVPVPNAAGQYFYFIDGVLVYPEDAQSAYEEVLTGFQAFMYLTVSGAISLGSSFAEMPIAGMVDTAAFAVQSMGDSDIAQLGNYKLRGDFLLAADLASDDLFVGTSAYIVP